MEFLKTEDGLINPRFIIWMRLEEEEGEFKGWYDVAFQCGETVRRTFADHRSVETLLKGYDPNVITP